MKKILIAVIIIVVILAVWFLFFNNGKNRYFNKACYQCIKKTFT